jgi:hypothetical protein
VKDSDPKLLDLRSAVVEVQRLREENVRLLWLLPEHGTQVPVAQSTIGIPVTASILPSAHTPALGTGPEFVRTAIHSIRA